MDAAHLVQPIATTVYEPPPPGVAVIEARGCWEERSDPLCPILISKAGDLSHQGEPVQADDLAEIAAKVSDLGYPVLGVAVHPSAQFSAVVEKLTWFEVLERPLAGSASWPTGVPRYFLSEMERRYGGEGEARNLGVVVEFRDRDLVGEPDQIRPALASLLVLRRAAELASSRSMALPFHQMNSMTGHSGV